MSNYIFKVKEQEKYSEFLKLLEKSTHAIILHSKDTILSSILAKLLVMKIECENEDSPCLMCSNCQKVLDNNAIDVEYFGEQKNIMVEDSEKIVEDSYILPMQFKNKYFVLYNFDKATVQAQNKLLKVIEEPKKFDKFILLTDNLDAVLSTIKSRCEIYDVPRFDDEELKNIFDFKLGDGKKVGFSTEYANGSLTKLDEIYNDEDFEDINLLCQHILTNMLSSANVLEYSSKILKYRAKIDLVLEILISLYRDILAIKFEKMELVQNKHFLNGLLVLSNGMSEACLVSIIKEIEFAKQKLKYNANLSGVVDNLLLKILEIKHICK